MSISVSSNTPDVMRLVSVALTRKTLDLARDMNTQLLQALPQAPGPAHLGQNVDLLA